MIFDLEVPIYDCHIALLVESTLEDFEEFYNDNKERLTEEEYKNIAEDIKDVGHVDGLTMQAEKGSNCLVYLRHPENKDDVAHEIFHVANKILMTRGVTFDADAEAWAYLIGWITKRFYEIISKDNDKQ
jgi:hypothetical protein